ncbi:MAG: GGDEF domain-containing protein [Actinomycetota bacterium]
MEDNQTDGVDPVPPLTDSELLRSLRSSIAVVDALGTILDFRHPEPEILGHDVGGLVGRHTFDFVAPGSAEFLAVSFADAGDSIVQDRPPPFQLELVGVDGQIGAFECLPRRIRRDDEVLWILEMTPNEINSLAFYGVDVYLDGGHVDEVARQITTRWTSVWDRGVLTAMFAIRDSPEGRSLVAPSMHPSVGATIRPLLAAVEDTLDDEDAPWNGDDRAPELDLDDLPTAVAEAARAAGLVACQLRADTTGDDHIALVAFGSHSVALSGNVTVLFDQAMRMLRAALRQEAAERVLRHAAEHDPLTSLANRTRFDRSMASLVDTDRDDVACIYVDIDHFKEVNDTYGHAAGDAVLVELGDRLRSVCREGDVVARLGGDEFAVLLSDSTPDEADAVAGRLLAAVRAPLPSGIGPERVTVSAGVSFGRPAELLGAADAALYESKRAGRDRAVTAPTDR